MIAPPQLHLTLHLPLKRKMSTIGILPSQNEIMYSIPQDILLSDEADLALTGKLFHVYLDMNSLSPLS